MAEQPSSDFVFIDALLLAYRHGCVRRDEQKASLLAATRAAKDALTFMTAIENFGVGRHTALYTFIGKYLSSPSYYRAQYSVMLGLRREGEPAESFLHNQRVLFLVEPVLTARQQDLFYNTYWWFCNNHRPTYFDSKKEFRKGIYATEPQDNVSTLQRFEDYLLRLVNHSSQRIRKRYEGFPADIVLAILKRAFT